MLRSYRLQITTWYLAFFSLLFVVFSIFLYGTVARALRNRLDEALVAESRTAAALFQGELQELAGDESAAAVEAVAEVLCAVVLIGLSAPIAFQEALVAGVSEGAARTGTNPGEVADCGRPTGGSAPRPERPF